MLAAVLVLAATVHLHGRVVDAATRKPLQGASVVATGRGASASTAVTDENGRFQIEAPADVNVITVEREGYVAFSLQGFRPRTGPIPTEHEIELCPEREEVFDHLEPEPAASQNPFVAAYDDALRRTLLPQGPERRAELLFIPSFSPEEALWIERGDDQVAFIVAVRMESNLWYQMNDAAPRKIVPPILTAKARIPEAFAERIVSLWERALRDARARPPPRGCISIDVDGENYHFAAGGLTAMTWSPDPYSNKAKLIVIARQLMTFARAPEEERAILGVHVLEEVESLLARFGDSPAK